MAATLTQMYTLRPAHAFVPRAGRRPADTNARSDTNAPPSRTQSPRWKRPKQQARRSWLSQMLMRERTKDYDAPDDEVVQRHEELEAQIANLEHRRQEAAARLAATAVPSRPPSRGAPSGVVAERLLGSAVPTTPATNRLEAVTHQPKRPASAMLSTHRTSRNNDTNDIKQTPRQYGTALLLKMGLPRAQTPDERTYITNSARDLLAQRGFSAVQKPPPREYPGVQRIGQQRGAGQNGMLRQLGQTMISFCPVPTAADHRLSMTKNTHNKSAIGVPPSRGSDGVPIAPIVHPRDFIDDSAGPCS